MSKWGEVEFKEAVDSVYDILWEMYRPKGQDGCDWDIEKEQKLLNMINCIDNELGR